MRQKLGQYFMTNQATIKKIVWTIGPQEKDTIIIEIGPGKGALTRAIRAYSTTCTIVAVEKDERLASLLEAEFAQDQETKIMRGDILKILPVWSAQQIDRPYKLCGNIPYYITGHLLRTIGGLEYKPAKTVLTIQREVAERLIAAPPHMNRLAATTQFWGNALLVDFVSRNSFHPVPTVDSAIITIETKPKHQTNEEGTRAYYATVHAIFQQPRKTILNNLLATLRGRNVTRENVLQVLREVGMGETDRPQNCSIDTLIILSRAFAMLLVEFSTPNSIGQASRSQRE